MSKRTLLIVIALLAVVDLIAGFWYLALRIEREGGSRDLFERQHDSTQLVVADTIDVVSVPDTFVVSEQRAWFVARQPMVSGDPASHCVSIKTAKLRWPQSVNGNHDIIALEQVLTTTALGAEHINLDEALRLFLDTPHFVTGAPAAYDRVSHMPHVAIPYRNEVKTLVYPFLTSFQLLVMEIDHVEHDGERTRRSCAYVHYDRVHQRVLSRGDMLQYDRMTRLLTLINAKIDHLSAQQPNLLLQHASHVPQEMCCTRSGIIFEFQEGEIAAADRGTIEVLIPYAELRSCLTEAFTRMIDNNDGYWRYKALE